MIFFWGFRELHVAVIQKIIMEEDGGCGESIT